MKVPGGEIAQQVVRADGGTYRVVVLRVRRRAAVRRDELVAAARRRQSLFLLLVGALGGEVLTRRIVRPLLVTAQTAHRISAGDVTARAPTDGPREVAEVGTALNRLADRIDELIAEERETVADLSHRLRTPLTALRLDAEALRDPGEADRVGSHVSEMERTLTAVIRAARRPQREGRMPSSDATAVVGDRVDVLVGAGRRPGPGLRRSTLPPGPLPVRAGAEDLAAAVDALLENVIAHTPEGVGVRGVARADGDRGRAGGQRRRPRHRGRRARARTQRSRLVRAGPRHRPPLRRGRRRLDDDRGRPRRRGPGHPAAQRALI